MDLPENKIIILFDGVCNLCNGFVQFVIKYDKKDTFRFASLQSKTGKEILIHLDLYSKKMDSVCYFESGIAYYLKSDAAIEIMKKLGGIFYLTIVLKIFPKIIRDFVYDFIAKNRYNWFGKKDNCMIPTLELKSKFID